MNNLGTIFNSLFLHSPVSSVLNFHNRLFGKIQLEGSTGPLRQIGQELQHLHSCAQLCLKLTTSRVTRCEQTYGALGFWYAEFRQYEDTIQRSQFNGSVMPRGPTSSLHTPSHVSPSPFSLELACQYWSAFT